MKLLFLINFIISSLCSNFNSFNNVNSDLHLLENKSIEFDSTIYIDGNNKVYFNDINSNNLIEDSWNYNETKTITIDSDLSNLDSNSKYLEIELPIGMELKMTPESIVDNKTILDVDTSKFAKNSIKTNTSKNYIPKSGTLRYKISPNIKKINLDILVSIDNVLWDTKSRYATTNDNKAIKITIGDENISDTKKIDNIIVKGFNYSPWVWNAVDSSVMIQDNDTSFKHLFLFSDYNGLFKEVELILEKPYTITTENGVEIKKYIDVTEIYLDRNGTVEEDGNRFICRWKNIYDKSAYVNFKLNPNKNKFNANEKVYINYLEGNITGLIHDIKYNILNKTTFTSKIYSNEISMISTSTDSRSVYKQDSNIDSLNLLGQYRIINIGCDSTSKLLNMTFPTTGIGVKTVTIPTPKEAGLYSIDITMWDYINKNEIQGRIEINKPASSLHRDGYKLTVSNICKQMNLEDYNADNLYIKSIEYVIKSLPSGYDSASGVDKWSLGYSGKFFGKPLEDAINNKSYESIFTLSDLSNPDSNPIINKCATTITDKGEATIRFEGLKVTDSNNKNISEIMAGENINFKGNIYCPSYPYNNSIFINSPNIYIKIPRNIKINEEKTNFIYKNNGRAELLNYSILNKNNPKILSDGHYIYKIKISNENILIGGYTENISTIGSLDYNLSFDIEKSSKTSDINFQDILWIDDDYINIGKVKDKWDVNENGSTNDYVLTSDSIRLSIISSTNWLDVSISTEGSNGNNTYQPIEDTSDIVKYGLTINNNNDGYVRIGKMEYFIPIPKKDIQYNEHILSSGNSFKFNMKLAEEVEPIEGFDILYSYDNENFSTDTNNLELDKVCMIKLINTKDILPGESFDFKVSIAYDDNTWDGDSNENTWNIYGQQTYEKNGSESTYLHVLDEFKIELIFNPKILKNPESKSIKVGESVTFSTNLDVGIPVATGNWQYRESSSDTWKDLNETSTTLFIDNISYNLNGYEYRYVATNKGATVESLPATLTVIDNEGPTITLNEFKDGDVYKITIMAIDNGSGISHIILPDGSRVNSNTYTMIVDVNTEYTFKVYDLAGNESIKSTMIGVIVPNTISSNLDVYIKSENLLSLSLDTNSITFDDFSGAEDVVKENAINLTIHSSLPYELNAYLPTEIQNSDKSKTMNKEILNIKENSEIDYKNFANINEKVVLKDNCSAGNRLNHGIDIKLKGRIAHEKDVYKTTIRFEVKQK